MIRTVVTADKNVIQLEIPSSYVGKQIEVIAFAVEEASQKPDSKKNKSFTTIKVNSKDYKFNRDELHER